ncbi:MAG: response regulator transcription factor [Sedimentisphaerales bacterium]|nr:response regulator transcription factor [Sedimentisphaerales bacterium]
MNMTILLADDHQLLREGLKSLLEKQQGITVVAEASNGQEALEKTIAHKPDIVVMDIHMPQTNGVEATREITQKVPQAKVLCLSMYSNRRLVADMLKAGAAGYLLKEAASSELLDALAAIQRGETYLCNKVSRIFVEDYIHRHPPANNEEAVLTDRESQVLSMLAEGKSTKEIALTIKLSSKTVDACRRQIMAKLNVLSVAELVKYAIREGLTSLEN